MKKLKVVLLTAALCFGLTGLVMAGSTDQHSVTVTVSAINEVAITGGAITLNINTAVAGNEPTAVTDNTSCDLKWTTNEATKKITVQTNLTTVNFPLKVVAENTAGGAAAPEVTLNTTATNFVTGISKTIGSCDLKYTANAPAAQGTGSETHTVTYTLTAG